MAENEPPTAEIASATANTASDNPPPPKPPHQPTITSAFALVFARQQAEGEQSLASSGIKRHRTDEEEEQQAVEDSTRGGPSDGSDDLLKGTSNSTSPSESSSTDNRPHKFPRLEIPTPSSRARRTGSAPPIMARAGSTSDSAQDQMDIDIDDGVPVEESELHRDNSMTEGHVQDVDMVLQDKADLILDGMERELTCMMCSDLYLEPVTLVQCGHTYCGSCVVKWLKSFKLRSSSSYTNPSPTLTSALSKLRSRERQAAAYADTHGFGAGGSERIVSRFGGAGEEGYRLYVLSTSTGGSTAGSASSGAVFNATSAMAASTVAAGQSQSQGQGQVQALAQSTWVNGSREEDEWYRLDGGSANAVASTSGTSGTHMRDHEADEGPDGDRDDLGESATHPFATIQAANPTTIVAASTPVPQPKIPTEKAGHKCPFCKFQPVTDAIQNHALRSLVEVYKMSRPEVERPGEEIEQAQRLYKRGDKFSFPIPRSAVSDSAASSSVGRSSSGTSAAEIRTRERDLRAFFKPCPNCKPLNADEMLAAVGERRYVCETPIPDPVDPTQRHRCLPANGMLPDGHIMCSSCNTVCAEPIALVCGLCGESCCSSPARSCRSTLPLFGDGHQGATDEMETLNYIYEYSTWSPGDLRNFIPIFGGNMVELGFFVAYVQYCYEKNCQIDSLPRAIAPPQSVPQVVSSTPISGTPGTAEPAADRDAAQLASGEAAAPSVSEVAVTVPSPEVKKLERPTTTSIIRSIATWLASEEGIQAGGIEAMYGRSDPAGSRGGPFRSSRRELPERVCISCSDGVLSAGLYEWWMREVTKPEVMEHLPTEMSGRAKCKHGRSCPHQSSLEHCKTYCHLCERMESEAFAAAEQAPPLSEEGGKSETEKLREVNQFCRDAFKIDTMRNGDDNESESEESDIVEDPPMERSRTSSPAPVEPINAGPEASHDMLHNDGLPEMDAEATAGNITRETQDESEDEDDDEPQLISVGCQTDECLVPVEDPGRNGGEEQVGGTPSQVEQTEATQAGTNMWNAEQEEAEVDANLPVAGQGMEVDVVQPAVNEATVSESSTPNDAPAGFQEAPVAMDNWINFSFSGGSDAESQPAMDDQPMMMMQFTNA